MKAQKKSILKNSLLLSISALFTLISFLVIFLNGGLDGAGLFMRIVCFFCLLAISIYIYKILMRDIQLKRFDEVLTTIKIETEYDSVKEMEEAYQAQRNTAVFQDGQIVITKDFLKLSGCKPSLFLLDGILLSQSFSKEENGVMTAVNLDVLYYDGNVYSLEFEKAGRKLNTQLADRVYEAVCVLAEKCSSYGKDPVFRKVMDIKMKG